MWTSHAGRAGARGRAGSMISGRPGRTRGSREVRPRRSGTRPRPAPALRIGASSRALPGQRDAGRVGTHLVRRAPNGRSATRRCALPGDPAGVGRRPSVTSQCCRSEHRQQPRRRVAAIVAPQRDPSSPGEAHRNVDAVRRLASPQIARAVNAAAGLWARRSRSACRRTTGRGGVGRRPGLWLSVTAGVYPDHRLRGRAARRSLS